MEQKVVLITGGSSGIGRALAFEFARHGSRVVITGRQQAPLQATEAELQAAGYEVLALVADVSREADCRQTVQQAVARFGAVDVLINNAGMSMRALFEDVDLAVMRQLMEINFYGTMQMTHAALPHVRAARGSIVGISSIAGYRGLPVRAGYSASKFAMNGFLEALRTELLHTGVHVLVASPGFTASNIRFTSLGKDGKPTGETMRDESRMMTAEATAAHIYRAVVARRRELVLTTQGKLTVFLNKWLPGLMDRLVYNELSREANSPLRR